MSHSLKSACGSSELSSFSNDGSQATTRCRFLRHNQSPAWEKPTIRGSRISGRRRVEMVNVKTLEAGR